MRTIHELNAAIVGTGFIGAVHLEALRRLGVGIAGVLGSSPERGAAKATEWGVARAYASLDEVLADAAVHVVHITSPNNEHFAQAKAALAAGKHVVCEKPLAMTSDETAELAALAASTGLVAAVNFNIRFYPQVREMRERVASGSIGRPTLVTGAYLQDWLLRDTDWSWRIEPSRGGELRAVGDVGTHWFDLATFVTGRRIVEVMADLTTFVPVRQKPVGRVESFSSAVGETEPVTITSEDAGSILVRFEDGARGVVTVSQISAGRKNSISLEVAGSAASLAWDGERTEELWIGHRDRANEVLLRDAALLSDAAAGLATMPGGHAEGFENGFKALYKTVYADVLAGAPSTDPAYATFADGHYESLVVEAVGRSAASGQWERVAL